MQLYCLKQLNQKAHKTKPKLKPTLKCQLIQKPAEHRKEPGIATVQLPTYEA